MSSGAARALEPKWRRTNCVVRLLCVVIMNYYLHTTTLTTTFGPSSPVGGYPQICYTPPPSARREGVAKQGGPPQSPVVRLRWVNHPLLRGTQTVAQGPLAQTLPAKGHPNPILEVKVPGHSLGIHLNRSDEHDPPILKIVARARAGPGGSFLSSGAARDLEPKWRRTN